MLTTGGVWVVAERRIRRDYMLQFRAETAARKLLQREGYRFRTFKTLSHHLGGFGDDELRKILVQCGALRFYDREGGEVWGLLDRVGDALEPETSVAGN